MKTYIYIGLFGFLGAASRYAVKNIDLTSLFQHFPINTLLINITGCLLFSLIVTLAYETRRLKPALRLGLTAGFLSAFTTFSAFCKEIVTLFSTGCQLNAVLYLFVSLFLGFAAAYAGTKLAKHTVIKILRKLNKHYHNVRLTGDRKN